MPWRGAEAEGKSHHEEAREASVQRGLLGFQENEVRMSQGTVGEGRGPSSGKAGAKALR